MSGFRVLVRAAAVVGLVGGGLGLTPNVVAQDRTSQTRDVGHPSAGPVAAKRVMTFTDLMAMKRVSDPQVSPSGRWVLFSVTDVSLEKNTKVNHLWVVSLDGAGVEATADSSAALRNDKRGGAGATGGAAERQITFGDGESFGRFSPDGKWVSMTVGDDVWLAPWDEAAGKVGEAKQLTRVSGGGADGAVWSPDSKRLMFVAQVWPECSVKNPSHDDGTVMNGAPGGDANATTTTEANTGVLHFVQDDGAKGVVAGGTRDVAGWRGAEAASWADEDACDKAKDAAVDGTPVKGQVWDGLFYRHWDHLTGAKRSHVLVVDVDGTGVRDLTPASAVGDAETPTFSLGGPLGYAWAPDGKEIAYVTNLDAVPAASTNNDVFTLRLDEVGARAVKISTSLGSDDGPEYSPDGKWLAFRSQKQAGFESDRFRLMLFDRGTKAIKDLMPRFNGWVDEFVWDASSESIYFASGEKGNEPLMKVAVSGANAGKSEILLGDGEFSEIRTTLSPQVVVASYVRMDMPSTVATIETRDPGSDEKVKYPDVSYVTKLAYLSHANDAPLSSLDLSRLESFWFTGAEGTKVEGFLLKPPNFDSAKKYPMKFLMHGGPQTAWGDSWSYRWNWELMAASGYVVIGINRRGSTGYGQKFVDEVSGDWGGRAYEDLMKGLDYAEAKFPFIDKTRECALGASYGGYMADWVLTHTNRFKCIVTHDGMYDPESAWGDTEEMWFNEWEFRRPEDFPKGWDGFPPQRSKTAGDPGFTGGYVPVGAAKADSSAALRNDKPIGGSAEGHAAEPWRYAGLAADQDPFRRWSPMRFIQNAKTPTLVIHSQKDYRLDVSQGMELFTALQRLGVPSKMLYFPDEGHWVLKPQNSQVWNEVVEDWCDRWTKTGKYAEASTGASR